MENMRLSVETIQHLKSKGFTSVIIFGASNIAELRDNPKGHLLANKELVLSERVTQYGFHVSIDDHVLIEISNQLIVFIEVP